MLRSAISAAGIEAMAFDPGPESREGVSRDYVANLRIVYLAAQNAALVRQTQFADAKATAVLAFAGLVGGRLAAGVDLAALGLGELALVAVKALVLLFCLLVLTPRYPREPLRARIATAERFSWVALATPTLGPDAYADFVREAEPSQLVVSMARANHALSQILYRKFRFLRAAFLIAAADVLISFAWWSGLAERIADFART